MLAHPRRRRLHIDRQRQFRAHRERPRGNAVAQIIDLLGHADRHQRAARAFRAVFERRRDAAAGGDEAQPADRGERLRAQLGVEEDADALAAFAEIERTFAAAVAVVFEDQALDAKLDALGVPGAGRDMRAPAALVIDRHHRAVLDFDQVEAGDQAEPIGGQGDRAGVDALVLADGPGLGRSGRGRPGDERRALRRCRPTRPIRPAPIRDRQAAGNIGTR
jgi:hypothetical protein